jgi:hypothetical protein
MGFDFDTALMRSTIGSAAGIAGGLSGTRKM